MTTALANTEFNTRLWPRYHVRLPVLICAEGDSSKVAVPGLACEISQRGMALYGGIDLLPGDLMEVRFQNSAKLSVSGIIRNRSGFCFGLEFLETMASPVAISDTLQPASDTKEAEEVPSWKGWFTTHRGDVAVAAAALLLFSAFLTAGSQTAQNQVAQNKPYQPSLTLTERMLVAFRSGGAPARSRYGRESHGASLGGCAYGALLLSRIGPVRQDTGWKAHHATRRSIRSIRTCRAKKLPIRRALLILGLKTLTRLSALKF